MLSPLKEWVLYCLSDVQKKLPPLFCQVFTVGDQYTPSQQEADFKLTFSVMFFLHSAGIIGKKYKSSAKKW